MPNATTPADATIADHIEEKTTGAADSVVAALESKASEAFSRAYSGWLKAKSEIEDPSVSDNDLVAALVDAEDKAERRLIATPAAYPDQVFQKLQAFEWILGYELLAGEKRYSLLMLAVGSIKQDMINLNLRSR